MKIDAVKWLDSADRLLRRRDHYTQKAIRAEFDTDPLKDAIEFDPQNHLFVTPVSDKRFVVVWELDRQDNTIGAAVKAVVPTQLMSDDLGAIRKQVNELVMLETKGELKLY